MMMCRAMQLTLGFALLLIFPALWPVQEASAFSTRIALETEIALKLFQMENPPSYEITYRKLNAYLGQGGDEPIDVEKVASDLWLLLAQWITEYLNENPCIDSENFKIALDRMVDSLPKDLDYDNPECCFNIEDQIIPIYSPRGWAYAVTFNWWIFSTFFIVGPGEDGIFDVVLNWELDPHDEGSFREERSWCLDGKGFFAEPIYFDLHALSDSGQGNPRFYSAACHYQTGGGPHACQLNIYEWENNKLLQLYSKIYGGDLSINGDTTKDGIALSYWDSDAFEFKVFSFCAEGRPRALCKLMITPNKCIELPCEEYYPGFQIIDELFYRIINKIDPSDIASQKVIHILGENIPQIADDLGCGSVGYPIFEKKGKKLIFSLRTSDFECTYIIRNANGKYFVEDIKAAIKND